MNWPEVIVALHLPSADDPTQMTGITIERGRLAGPVNRPAENPPNRVWVAHHGNPHVARWLDNLNTPPAGIIDTNALAQLTYPAATSHALDDLTRTRALNLSDTPWQHRPAQATALLLLHMAKQYRHWTELAEAARGSAPTSPPARTSTEDA